MLSDLTHAVRTLGRTPGFTAVATLTLALGIGANTAIFSVVHAVLLKPLPYRDAAALMAIHETLPPGSDSPASRRMPLTPPTTRDWRDNRSFSNFAVYASADFILTGAGEPDRVRGAQVTWSFFDTMGAAPIAGRLLTEDDDQPNHPLVAVIGHDLWRTRFGSDPRLLGQEIELSGRRHTVVGILPASFDFPESSLIWTPLALDASEFADNQRLSFYLDAVGRLAPGVNREQAEDELSAIASRLAARFPDQYAGRGAAVVRLHDAVVGDVKPALLLLLGIVGAVLLIACANVANLLLARSAAREGELALRAALGASRWRIVRQLLTEALVLAAGGAAGGVLMALWARDVIVGLSDSAVPRLEEVRLDAGVLGFTLLLALATVVVFGLVPAILAARRAPDASLRTARAAGTTRGRRRLGHVLVVGEIAVSLMLLTGAGLLAKTVWHLVHVDPGFQSSGLMTMEIVLPRAKYPDASSRVAFFDRVLDGLRANPTISSAGGATNLPLSGTNMVFGFYRQDMIPDRDVPLSANFRAVSTGYFHVLGIPIVRGRTVAETDREGSPPIVVINDTMRRRFWPDRDPLGQRLAITRGRTTVWREIVGVVGDVRHEGLGEAPEPEMYIPYAHDPFLHLRIAVRSTLPPDVLAGALRAAVWAVDRDQPVSRVRPMDAVVSASMRELRFNAISIGSFAALALVLAAVGLYGVLAYSVSLRTREFGVRMALGAERRHVVALVFRQGFALGVLGLLLGLALSVGLSRLIAAQLYRTTPTDPATFGAVSAVLLAVALLASYVPTRRAIRVDPITVLRD